MWKVACLGHGLLAIWNPLTQLLRQPPLRVHIHSKQNIIPARPTLEKFVWVYSLQKKSISEVAVHVGAQETSGFGSDGFRTESRSPDHSEYEEG